MTTALAIKQINETKTINRACFMRMPPGKSELNDVVRGLRLDERQPQQEKQPNLTPV
jgi:hypothetical protein